MVVSVLLSCSGQASVKRDVESVQGLLPAVGPAGSALAGRVEAADGQVQHFQRGLFVGEMAAGVDRSTESGVEALDRVGTRYERARRPACCSASPALPQRWRGVDVGHTV